MKIKLHPTTFWHSLVLPLIVGLPSSCDSLMVSSLGADELRLRTGRELKEVRVISFDEDGVLLDDGRRISLDQIQSAVVSRQAAFDEIHERISLDLFRLKLRLRHQDVENLQPHLSRLRPILRDRTSRSAVIVETGVLLESVQQGKWELAIAAHFRLFALVAGSPENAAELRQLPYDFDPQTGLSGWLCPVGIPRARLLEHWEQVVGAYRALPDPHPSGLDFYFFHLARVAETEVDPALAPRRLNLTTLETMLLETLHPVMTATQARDWEAIRVRLVEQPFGPRDGVVHRALFYFVRGLLEARSEAGDSDQGLLDLLRIHAEFGSQTESLSAAALFYVAEILGSQKLPQAEKNVERELMTRYPSSYFAKQLKMQTEE